LYCLSFCLLPVVLFVILSFACCIVCHFVFCLLYCLSFSDFMASVYSFGICKLFFYNSLIRNILFIDHIL